MKPLLVSMSPEEFETRVSAPDDGTMKEALQRGWEEAEKALAASAPPYLDPGIWYSQL